MIIGITIAGPTLENRTGWEADLHQSRDERLGRAESRHSGLNRAPAATLINNEALYRIADFTAAIAAKFASMP
jgi:hypothetical protein